MNDLGNRILHLRKSKGLSQSELAQQIGISYAQIGRYETKGVQPPAEIIKKIADVLETTVDFLINGSTEDKAKELIKDSELIRYFKEVDALNADDKNALIKVIAGFIRDAKTRNTYALVG